MVITPVPYIASVLPACSQAPANVHARSPASLPSLASDTPPCAGCGCFTRPRAKAHAAQQASASITCSMQHLDTHAPGTRGMPTLGSHARTHTVQRSDPVSRQARPQRYADGRRASPLSQYGLPGSRKCCVRRDAHRRSSLSERWVRAGCVIPVWLISRKTMLMQVRSTTLDAQASSERVEHVTRER